jgi:hypothetical protein
MTGRNNNLLNRLERELPEGLLAHSAWFRKKGYSRQLLNHYVSTGWLEQPARGLFRRPRGTLSWQQVVISLQTILLDHPFIVGGRTALDLQGYAHFLPQQTKEVHLYGPRPAADLARQASAGRALRSSQQPQAVQERSDHLRHQQPYGERDCACQLQQ